MVCSVEGVGKKLFRVGFYEYRYAQAPLISSELRERLAEVYISVSHRVISQSIEPFSVEILLILDKSKAVSFLTNAITLGVVIIESDILNLHIV